MKHTVIDRPHTVSSYDQQLAEVRSIINEMADRARALLTGALTALETGDLDAAKNIVAQDKEIDALELSLERLVLLIITSRAPMAQDLRYLIVSIRIAKMLERTGDQAKRIAKRVAKLGPSGLGSSAPIIGEMGEYANTMVADAMKSFNRASRSRAGQVVRADVELNRMHEALKQSCSENMRNDRQSIAQGVECISIGKQLERVGDYASNIAADVRYMITGDRGGDWA